MLVEQKSKIIIFLIELKALCRKVANEKKKLKITISQMNKKKKN